MSIQHGATDQRDEGDARPLVSADAGSPTTLARVVLGLQRTAGNAAVGRMASAGAFAAPARARILQRAPTLVPGTDPPHYIDPQIPGATLVADGLRLRDSAPAYRVVGTNVRFFFQGGAYFDAQGRRINNPATLAPPQSSTAPQAPPVDDNAMDVEPERGRKRKKSEAQDHEPADEQEQEDPASKRPRRNLWRPADEFERRLKKAYRDIVRRAIRLIFDELRQLPGGLQPYGMQGNQSATSHAHGHSFTTTMQMHSEMCALDAMLKHGLYRLTGGGQILAPPGGFVFQTPGVPHCGFCTFFLALLGLPLTTPTKGNFNQATNLSYPLPPAIADSLPIVDRILRLGGDQTPNRIDALLALAGIGQDVTWIQFDARGYLGYFWRLVFEELYGYCD